MSFADRQVPAPGEIFLDHVGWFLPSLAETEAFARLGFPLTPYTAHQNADPQGGPPVRSGTANRCAMLRLGYLEFLEAVPGLDTPLTRAHHAAVARYAGVHLLAFTVADAAAEAARLAAAGFAPEPVVLLRRATDIGEARFSVLRTALERMPEGRIQTLVQETPEIVWRETFIARDNGIDALAGVVLEVADPAEAAARYARYLGRPAAANRIVLDRGRLSFRRGTGILPRMSAVELVSRDLDRTRAYLKARGIAVPERDGALAVDAAGAALVIYNQPP